MTESPSRWVRKQCLARLDHATYGFNKTYLEYAAAVPGVPPIVIDFTKRSNNFIEANVEMEDILATSSYRFPFFCLYSSVGMNQNQQKFSTFSGPVRVGGKVSLSFLRGSAVPSFEDTQDVVEQTVITVFNREETQNWPNNLSYAGQIGFERPRVTTSAQNWLQTFFFSLTFDVTLR